MLLILAPILLTNLSSWQGACFHNLKRLWGAITWFNISAQGCRDVSRTGWGKGVAQTQPPSPINALTQKACLCNALNRRWLIRLILGNVNAQAASLLVGVKGVSQRDAVTMGVILEQRNEIVDGFKEVTNPAGACMHVTPRVENFPKNTGPLPLWRSWSCEISACCGGLLWGEIVAVEPCPCTWRLGIDFLSGSQRQYGSLAGSLNYGYLHAGLQWPEVGQSYGCWLDSLIGWKRPHLKIGKTVIPIVLSRL